MKPMKTTCVKLILIVALAGFVVLLPGRRAAAKESYEASRDVTYVERDGESLKADIYVPAGEGPFPTVLCVHGGAWRFGARGDMGLIARSLAESGYVAATISYRLAPAHKFPAQIEDCREALRWIREHADEYKVDPKRVAALGYSAGGHLVALMGVTGKAEDTIGPENSPWKFDSRLKAVVAGGAPCDFREMPADKRILAYWLGGTRAENPDVYEAASPAKFVSAKAPPTFFFHGERDRLVKMKSPTAMMSLLKEAGVPTEMHVVSGARHIPAFLNTNAYVESIKFLDKYMKPPVPDP